MVLPADLSEATFNRAMERFREVVGPDWVFTDEENVNLYRDAYSPLWGEEEERVPSAAVAPSSAEEVQEVVRIANELSVPLYPISTGMNLGYGGAAPNLRGSVVLDLKRMNRIIEVDADRGFAIVEPGVAYFDLYRYINEQGLDLWIDCPDPGWGSVIGNALDHGVGYTYGTYRDHFSAHCGMEVVLPDGEIMRTGMGAMPNAESWGEYHYGFGPYIDGLFSQGNIGVVTKMGIHLMPAPQAYRRAFARAPRRADIIPMVKIVNRLEHAGLIGMPRYGSPMRGIRDEGLAALVDDPNGWDADAIDDWAQTNNVPYWEVQLQFYGPEKTIDANWEYAQDLFNEAVSGATFEEGERARFPLSDEEIHNFPQRVSLGIPQLEVFSIGIRTETNPTPRDGHLWFAPVIPKSGEAVLRAQEVFSRAFREAGLPPAYGPFSGPSTWMYRTFVFLTGLSISRSNSEENQRTRALFHQLIDIAAENGWGEYRTPPAFQDKVMSTYSFNDNVLLRFHEKIKDAIDPNGIISAGRSGIWPKHIREQRT